MALSLKERLRLNTNTLERFGLPVRFLRYVLPKYDFAVGSSDQVFHILDSMELTSDTLDDLNAINPLGKAIRGGGGIATLYEEFTHAYFDLKSDEKDGEVLQLLREAEGYYRGAPMTDGSQCSDPARVTQEAAGEFVGRRAAAYWFAYANLARYTVQDLSGLTTQRMEWFLRRTRQDYDKGMSANVHGYEERGRLWWQKQVRTRKPIFPKLKKYCDSVLLEKRLSASFQDNTRLAALLAHVRTRMVAAGLSAPGAPARTSPLRLAQNRR